MRVRSHPLVLLLTGLLVALGLPALQAAPAAAAPGVWQATGPGVRLVSDGADGAPSLAYDWRQSFSGEWELSTTAASAAEVGLPWSWQGFHSYFRVTTRLVAFVDRAEPEAADVSTVLVDAGPVNCCTPPSGGFDEEGTAAFEVQPGDRFGFRLSGSHFDSAMVLSGTFTVRAQEPDEPNTTWPAARVLAADGTTTDRLKLPGQARWYRFPVQPDSVVQVDVDGLPADYDVTLFRDIGQAFTDVTSVGDLALVNAEFAADAFSPSVFSPSVFSPSVFSPSVFSPSVFSPSVFSPSVFSPSVFSPSVFSPSVFSPSVPLGSTLDPSALAGTGLTPDQLAQAFSSAQVRSLVAVSARDGLAPESVRASTWNATGSFYVRVEGRNGAFDPTGAYSVRVTTTPGTCGVPLSGFTELPTWTRPAGAPATPRTVVLTDTAALRAGYPQADVPGVGAALAAFAARPEVAGVVVDVAGVPRVEALKAQAAQQVDCPAATNLLAAELRDLVNGLRGTDPDRPTLQYVVLAGDDSVVPFFRRADGSGLGPEENFVPPVRDGTASQASLRRNQVLTQDPYGARQTLTLKGADVAVPDVAVGRLVETPAEITAALSRYAALGGLLPTPRSSLVTGYDFLTDAADDVAGQLRSALGTGATTTELITDAGVPTSRTTVGGVPSRTTSWTADDLRAALRARRNDVVYLAGHFSANSALAADDRTSVVTTELAGPDVDLTNSLVLSAGCHSGYTVVDGHAVPGVTLGLDWTQLLARKGATFVAGTGYQYGDTDFLEYSERLYSGLVAQLRQGTGAVALGTALLRAKQEYLASTPSLTGIHQKALAQATLYGLPMLGLDLPAGRTLPPVAPPVTPTPVESNPGAALGLATRTVDVAPALVARTKPDASVPGGVRSWLEGPDGVQTLPGRPALPLQSLPVGTPDAAVRGVLVLSGTYAERGGTVPLTGSAATEYGAANPPFASQVALPRRLATANGLGQVAGDGGTRLLVTPAQYRDDPAVPGAAVERRWDRLGVRLFYSGNVTRYGLNVPALAAPPSIGDVRSTVAGAVATGATVEVSARVVGDPSAGIQQAWATWTARRGPAFGTLDSVALVRSEQDSTLWRGTVRLAAGQDPQDVRFTVQAVNGVGLVGVEDNQGQEFVPGTAPALDPPPAGLVASSLTLTAPASGVLGSTVAVSAVLADAAGAAAAGRTVTFSLGARSVGATTDGTGVARASLPLVDGVGASEVVADFAGDVAGTPPLRPSSARAALAVTRRPSALTVAGSGTVLAGTETGVRATVTSAGAPVAERAVWFVASAGGVARVAVVRRTDASGVARLGALDLPDGPLTVTAYFADPAVPVPGGTLDATDREYLRAGPASTTLTVVRYRFDRFGDPVVDGGTTVAERTSTVPVRIRLLTTGGVPVPDAEGAALARACRVVVLAPTGAGKVQSACLAYDAALDRFAGAVNGKTLGWKPGQTFALTVELRAAGGAVLASRSTPVRVK